jgi:hypothetical protein
VSLLSAILSIKAVDTTGNCPGIQVTRIIIPLRRFLAFSQQVCYNISRDWSLLNFKKKILFRLIRKTKSTLSEYVSLIRTENLYLLQKTLKVKWFYKISGEVGFGF